MMRMAAEEEIVRSLMAAEANQAVDQAEEAEIEAEIEADEEDLADLMKGRRGTKTRGRKKKKKTGTNK